MVPVEGGNLMANLDLSRFSLGQLLGLLGELQIASPWAILLVQFSDQTQAWPPLTKYQDLFTSAGLGKLNMVDFFHDMSHGQLDISGTKIFGPFKLPAKRTDYGVTLDRNGVRDLAKTTAVAGGVNLADFAGVCVSFLGQVDLCGWIGGMAALCDTLSLSPSLLGQEMGHGYGLDHARIYGSTADYQDPWDVMSTADAYMAPHAEFTNVGPGMNAWEMRSRGWLDETRVWTAPAPSWDALVQLRPLHRTDLPGFLAAQVGSYLVEFRVPERWDAAIPRAGVLVHSFLNNHSYLMYSYSGSRDIVAGDKFAMGDPNYLVFGYYAAEVVTIDEPNLTATVRLHQRPPHPVPVPQAVGQVPLGLPVEGAIMAGNKVIKLPTHGLALKLVEEVARYLDIEISTNNVETAMAARRQALEAVVRAVIGLYSEAAPTSEHPPGYLKHRQKPERAE
jgi:hypothetical protein